MTPADTPVAGRNLRPLFDPRSVAILGASNDPGKWGHWLARGALKGGDRRSVYLVNRRADAILGQPVYRSLAELPGPAELVLVTVPAAGFEQAVDDALAAGAKAIVAISAGLGEMGAEGAARERAAVERVRAAGAVLLGPNCLGVFDAGAALDLASNELPGGSIGLISQSGNLALELGLLASDYGLGFSRFVSLGNQADLEASEVVADFAHHDRTELIAIYCEDFRDGRAFARGAAAAVAAGKPVILLDVGRSEAGVHAARSHTGALVSHTTAVEAACHAAGVLRVSTPRELVDLAQGLLARVRPLGPRVGVVGDGGGHGVIACDVAAAHGLETPRLSASLASTLAEVLPPTASTANPVDLAGGGEQDLWNYERTVRALLESGEVDALVLTGYFGGYSQYTDEFRDRETAVATAIAEAAATAHTPVVAQTMYPASDPAQALRRGHVPVFREIEAAVGVLARLVATGKDVARGVPTLPARSGERVDDGGYFASRTLLERHGVRFAEARRADSIDEARSVARELGYPVVLKALGLLHKSDAGGVVLGIRTEEELEHELSNMATRLSPEAYSVERTAPVGLGVELIVGARWDTRFGPIALAGLGGLYAELLDDVAVGLAPLDLDTAEALLRSLRGAPLLLGARGRPPLAVRAAAQALAALSVVAAEHPEIAEIEVNPLLVTADEALGLDARAILVEEGDDDAR